MKFVNTAARVALYLRAETLVQAARQAALLQHVTDRTPQWRIVAVFCDLTSCVARPGRDGAISPAATGFDVLLVMGLDRLSRDTDELHELIAQLIAADVTLGTVYRPNGPQCDAEIRAVDESLLTTHRTLAAAQRPGRALPAGRPPTSEQR